MTQQKAQTVLPHQIPDHWEDEAQEIITAIRQAGWSATDVEKRVSVNRRNNPRYVFQERLLVSYIVIVEGRICTCCLVAANPSGPQPEDGYRLHA